MLVCRDVTTIGAKGLCKSAHENVDFRGINSKIIADTTATGTKGTNGMSLIDKQVELVLLLQLDQLWEIAHGAFHRVKTFDNDQNLLPRAMAAWLTGSNLLSQQPFEIVHVIVLEHADDGTRETNTITDGGVVKLIGDDQTSLGNKGRERSRVGSISHRKDHRSRLANEIGNELFDIIVKIQRTGIRSGGCGRIAILAQGLFDRIGTRPFRLGKSEIIVRAHVQCLSGGTSEFKSGIEIIRRAIKEGDVTARDAGDWPSEAVVDADLQPTHIKVVEITVQRCIPLSLTSALMFMQPSEVSTHVLLLEMLVILLPEDLAEEVPYVTEHDEDQIRNVGGEEVVVWWLVFYGILDGLSLGVLRHITMTRVAQRSELCMLASQFPGLLRRGR